MSNYYTIEERKPQKGILVLVISESENYYIASRCSENCFKTSESKMTIPVRQWCYIPKPNRKKQNTRKRKKCTETKNKRS